MESLSIDALRILARGHDLDLTDAELAALLPLVESGRALARALADAPLDGVEPPAHFRML